MQSACDQTRRSLLIVLFSLLTILLTIRNSVSSLSFAKVLQPLTVEIGGLADRIASPIAVSDRSDAEAVSGGTSRASRLIPPWPAQSDASPEVEGLTDDWTGRSVVPNLSYGQFVLFYSFIALANCRGALATSVKASVERGPLFIIFPLPYPVEKSSTAGIRIVAVDRGAGRGQGTGTPGRRVRCDHLSNSLANNFQRINGIEERGRRCGRGQGN